MLECMTFDSAETDLAAKNRKPPLHFLSYQGGQKTWKYFQNPTRGSRYNGRMQIKSLRP